MFWAIHGSAAQFLVGEVLHRVEAAELDLDLVAGVEVLLAAGGVLHVHGALDHRVEAIGLNRTHRRKRRALNLAGRAENRHLVVGVGAVARHDPVPGAAGDEAAGDVALVAVGASLGERVVARGADPQDRALGVAELTQAGGVGLDDRLLPEPIAALEDGLLGARAGTEVHGRREDLGGERPRRQVGPAATAAADDHEHGDEEAERTSRQGRDSDELARRARRDGPT